MKVAAIDIGTNTALLLVASVDGAGNIVPVLDEERIPRLGKGVDRRKTLQHDSMNRVLKVLEEYRQLSAPHKPDVLVLASTSAVRDSENRDEFRERVRAQTGYDLEVLDGDEEARWTYLGARSAVAGSGLMTVVDIGGGSTEIIVGDHEDIRTGRSLDIGSVRLTERYFTHDPPSREEIENARISIRKALGTCPAFDSSALIGVAGTAAALALLDQSNVDFAWDVVDGYPLRIHRVNSLLQHMQTMPSGEIRTRNRFLAGREDIIVAGALILSEVMTMGGFHEVIVSSRGLRYGLVLREWKRQMANHPPPRLNTSGRL
jgi:exopolyphosphatase/guanosine-5'-triphosphate,3'-diphosphate pyrophosphatase